MENTADFKDVIEDYAICDQMVVLDNLTLLFPIICGGDVVPTKR